MHPVKAIAIGLLAWPAAEIVAFFCVAAAVGFANAVILVALTSLAGLLVLRHFGGRPQRIRTGGGFVSAAGWSGELAPGVGGIFLLIPGFLTSALGLAIMIPVSRRWLLAGLQRLFAASRRPTDPDVVDLAPGEWRPLPAEKPLPSERRVKQ